MVNIQKISLFTIFRSFVLLSALLPGWKKAGATLSPREGGAVVSQGGQPQI